LATMPFTSSKKNWTSLKSQFATKRNDRTLRLT
jgi:hypothetical protein